MRQLAFFGLMARMLLANIIGVGDGSRRVGRIHFPASTFVSTQDLVSLSG